MIPWKGNSGGAGSVPHLSFVKRKPEPLGVELKTVCDCTTGATCSSCVCHVHSELHVCFLSPLLPCEKSTPLRVTFHKGEEEKENRHALRNHAADMRVMLHLTLGFVRCLSTLLSTKARQIVVDRALLQRFNLRSKALPTPIRRVFVESEAGSSKANP